MNNYVVMLIEELRNRPVLWNKWHEHYNNRTAVNEEWAKVAKALAPLNRDLPQIKNKWRNLRDQFQRESRKVKVSSCGKINKYTGKWCYFQLLYFLKDVTSATPVGEQNTAEPLPFNEVLLNEPLLKNEDWTLSIEGNSHSTTTFNETEELDEISSDEADNVENSVQSSKNDKPQLEVAQHPQLHSSQHNKATHKEPSKRLDCESNASEPEINSKKLEESESQIDEDLYFVKSLVPFLRKLNPVRKLIVRNEMQSLLIRELQCEKCRTEGPQPSCRCSWYFSGNKKL